MGTATVLRDMDSATVQEQQGAVTASEASSSVAARDSENTATASQEGGTVSVSILPVSGGAVSAASGVISQGHGKALTRSIDRNGTEPSSLIYGNGLLLRDKDDENIGIVRPLRHTNGNSTLQLASFNRNAAGTGDVDNWVEIGVKRDGTRTISVADPSAWRTAIGAIGASHALLSRFWCGSTGSNTYVDIPVHNLSASYRRQSLWLFITPNNGDQGVFAYVGINDSGEATTAKVIFNSASLNITVSATADKTNNTVRVNVNRNWSYVMAISSNSEL